MNRSALIFLLICSALFNLFFIAGVLVVDRTDNQPDPPDRRGQAIHRIVSEMDLDPRQKAEFEALSIEFRFGEVFARVGDVFRAMYYVAVGCNELALSPEVLWMPILEPL